MLVNYAKWYSFTPPQLPTALDILKGPVHLLENRSIHFPASLAQAFPNYPVISIIPTVVVILGGRDKSL